MYSTGTIIRDCRDPYLSAQNVKAWRDRYSLRVEVYPGGVHAFCVSTMGPATRKYRVMGFDPFNPAHLARLSEPRDSSAEAWREARARLAAEGWHVPGPTSKLRREGLAHYPIAVRKGSDPGFDPSLALAFREGEGHGAWYVKASPRPKVCVFQFEALHLPGKAQRLSFTGITAGGKALEALTAKPIRT